jgi:hypothetical protein
MTSLLEADDIRDALRELARRLASAGVPAEIRVVGGAALAIEYFDRPATRDVDCLLSPADHIKAVAAEVARVRGWPPDWLNDKVVMFQSHHDSEGDWKTVLVEGAVTVRVASAELLLAMKLLAGRGKRDGDDIEQLLVACGVTSVPAAEEIFDRFYPDEQIKQAARQRLETRLRPDD